jgi:hypothetical protein
MDTASTDDPAVGEGAATEALARWYQAWNTHDVAAISALMTEDVRYEYPSARAGFAAMPWICTSTTRRNGSPPVAA